VAAPTTECHAWRIAVLGDTHIEPAAGAEPRANRRSRAAIARLGALRPDLVVHLGDIVHTLPALPGQDAAWDVAAAMLADLPAPLVATPGNHDIGDKPNPSMPAAAVREAWQRRWVGRVGPLWRSHRLGDAQIVLVAGPILGSGTACEDEQWAWLETTLAAGRREGARIFLFTHYPPFLLDPNEPGHYDNLDPAPRGRLLALIRRHGVEAVVSGHVHGFFHNRDGETDHYVVPSVAFARRDYAELVRIAPAEDEEHGRNDRSRLGLALIEIDAVGHRYHPVATDGAEDAEPGWRFLPPPHPRAGGRALLGVPLLHDWAGTVALPVNPPTAPFRRRRVRDDRTTLLAWSLGLDRLRIPLDDLIEPDARARVIDLAAQGMRFWLHSAGVPDRALLDSIAAAPLAGWELTLRGGEIDAAAEAIAAHPGTLPPERLVAPIVSTAEREGAAAHDLFVGGGFAAADAAARRSLLAAPVRRAAFTGTMTRLPRELAPFEAIRALAAERDAAATVALAPATPDAAWREDGAIAARVAEAAFAAWCFPAVPVWLDTFADIDRGYFVRHGIADRRLAPRTAGLVLRHLHAALAGLTAPADAVVRATPLGRTITARVGSARLVLALPAAPDAAAATALLGSDAGQPLDLSTGRESAGTGTGIAFA
jgi:predicted phosphodiesterase